jgi:hypothetical protein
LAKSRAQHSGRAKAYPARRPTSDSIMTAKLGVHESGCRPHSPILCAGTKAVANIRRGWGMAAALLPLPIFPYTPLGYVASPRSEFNRPVRSTIHPILPAMRSGDDGGLRREKLMIAATSWPRIAKSVERTSKLSVSCCGKGTPPIPRSLPPPIEPLTDCVLCIGSICIPASRPTRSIST